MSRPGVGLLLGGVASILLARESAVGWLVGIPAVSASLPLVFRVPTLPRGVVWGFGQPHGEDKTVSDGRLRRVWGRVQGWGRAMGDPHAEASVLLGFGALGILTLAVVLLSAALVVLLVLLLGALSAGSRPQPVQGSAEDPEGDGEKRNSADRHVAFPGISPSGYPVLTVNQEGRVFQGAAISGHPLYTVVGKHLFEGIAISGSPLATLVGERIFPGISISGSPMATLVGTHAFAGQAPSGSPLVTVPSGDRITLFAAAYHTVRGS